MPKKGPPHPSKRGAGKQTGAQRQTTNESGNAGRNTTPAHGRYAPKTYIPVPTPGHQGFPPGRNQNM